MSKTINIDERYGAPVEVTIEGYRALNPTGLFLSDLNGNIREWRADVERYVIVAEAQSHTVIIPQKMSGTGTIHDLSSEHHDRQIVFRPGDKYAIVLAAYYGTGDNYYVAQDRAEAIRIHEEQGDYSHGVIDRDGEIVTLDHLYYF